MNIHNYERHAPKNLGSNKPNPCQKVRHTLDTTIKLALGFPSFPNLFYISMIP